jgi:thioredoxin 1
MRTLNKETTSNFIEVLEMSQDAKYVEVTDQNFAEEVLKSDVPVLVDFWAAWCGPCRMVAPVIEEMAGEYEGRAKIAKMDVDRNMMTPHSYGVRSIPTLLIFKDGQVVDQVIGAVPKRILTTRLDAQLEAVA